MCVAVPREVVRVWDDRAEVLVDGQPREVVCASLPDLQPGDFVLLHADAAIERLSPAEARETLEFIAAMDAMFDDPESTMHLFAFAQTEAEPAAQRVGRGEIDA